MLCAGARTEERPNGDRWWSNNSKHSSGTFQSNKLWFPLTPGKSFSDKKYIFKKLYSKPIEFLMWFNHICLQLSNSGNAGWKRLDYRMSYTLYLCVIMGQVWQSKQIKIWQFFCYKWKKNPSHLMPSFALCRLKASNSSISWPCKHCTIKIDLILE